MLVNHFIENAAQSMNKKAPQPPPELYTLLTTYHFPGNVRELRAMVYDAVAQHKTGRVLSMKSFHRVIQTQQASALIEVEGKEKSTDQFPTLKEAERLHIQAALRQANGNQGIAATLLGISRPALNRRLAHLNTSDKE